MSTEISGEFPYEEIRDESGDFFHNAAAALAVADDSDQVWSVVSCDVEEYGVTKTTTTYGPPHHYVDVIGFVVTKERHDHSTYYTETEDFI